MYKETLNILNVANTFSPHSVISYPKPRISPFHSPNKFAKPIGNINNNNDKSLKSSPKIPFNNNPPPITYKPIKRIQNSTTITILPAQVKSHVKLPVRRNNKIVAMNVVMKIPATNKNRLYGAGLKKSTLGCP